MSVTKKRECKFLHFIGMLLGMGWLRRRVCWRYVEKRVGNYPPKRRNSKIRKPQIHNCSSTVRFTAGFKSNGQRHWFEGKGRRRIVK